MTSPEFPSAAPAWPARRRFVQGLALAGVAGSGLLRMPALAMTPAELKGRHFDLSIGATTLDITGRPRPAVAINGSVPAPLLRWREGDTVTVQVRNRLADAPSSIHWHGILLPSNMDGVPGMSFDGIAPGESWLYRFTLRQSGTYWYHSHSLFQEQAGLYGPIIVDPLQPPPYRYDREHVLLLSDWTDLAPDALFRRLKKAPSYDNLYKRTAGDFVRDSRERGLRATLADRGMWGRMRMTPTDLSDVNGNTYTYLLNGQPPASNWTGLFRPGEKVLLRLINAGAMTYFDVRIPGLKMTVVAADGQYVHPVTVDELRIAAAEAVHAAGNRRKPAEHAHDVRRRMAECRQHAGDDQQIVDVEAAEQRRAHRQRLAVDVQREGDAAIVADIMAGFAHPDAVTVERDRRRAIEHAIGAAKPGDIVLIAGKGHEPYQEIAGVRHPFDDTAVAAAALDAWSAEVPA